VSKGKKGFRLIGGGCRELQPQEKVKIRQREGRKEIDAAKLPPISGRVEGEATPAFERGRASRERRGADELGRKKRRGWLLFRVDAGGRRNDRGEKKPFRFWGAEDRGPSAETVGMGFRTGGTFFGLAEIFRPRMSSASLRKGGGRENCSGDFKTTSKEKRRVRRGCGGRIKQKKTDLAHNTPGEVQSYPFILKRQRSACHQKTGRYLEENISKLTT